MDFIINFLLLLLVIMGIIEAFIVIIWGIIFVVKCVICLFENALDEMREKRSYQ